MKLDEAVKYVESSKGCVFGINLETKEFWVMNYNGDPDYFTIAIDYMQDEEEFSSMILDQFLPEEFKDAFPDTYAVYEFFKCKKDMISLITADWDVVIETYRNYKL
tara:strand:+ start:114 stop:431 length:318 start_codon:yes stop_codon:yes gene_type:complete